MTAMTTWRQLLRRAWRVLRHWRARRRVRRLVSYARIAELELAVGLRQPTRSEREARLVATYRTWLHAISSLPADAPWPERPADAWYIGKKHQDVIHALRANGFDCAPMSFGDDGPWRVTDCLVPFNGRFTLLDGQVVESRGTTLRLATSQLSDHVTHDKGDPHA